MKSILANAALLGGLATVLTVLGLGAYAALPALRATQPATESGEAMQVVVTGVVDGDTLRVRTRQGDDLGRVRLLGIDAAEVAHGAQPAECYGDRATAALRELTPVGATITLTTDPAAGDRDRYDRLLRYVDRDDTDVAQELLKAGMVRLYGSNSGLAREWTYREAAETAQATSAGLWRDCPPEK